MEDNIIFLSSRRRHTRCALVTGVQTCALPIYQRRLAVVDVGNDRNVADLVRLNRHDVVLAFSKESVGRLRRAWPGACRARRRPARQACAPGVRRRGQSPRLRSEEHTSELQSLMRISYAVFCLEKKKQTASISTH